MQIIFDEKQQIFHLYNEKISYVIQVEKQRYLKHCYYGKRLKSGAVAFRASITTEDFVQIRLLKTGRFRWTHSKENFRNPAKEISEVRPMS